MSMDFLGPYCQKAGIRSDALISKSCAKIGQLSNGIVVEIFNFSKKNKQTFAEFCNTLTLINDGCQSINQATLSSRVNSVLDQKKKLVSKKKVPGVKNIDELLGKEFNTSVPIKTSHVTENVCCNEKESDAACQSNEVQLSDISIITYSSKNIGIQTESETELNCTKQWNMKKYLCNKQSRKLRVLKNQEAEYRQKLESISIRIGHYSVKNVDKRDCTSKINNHRFRELQRLNKKTTSKLHKTESACQQHIEEMELLRRDHQELHEQHQLLTQSIITEKSIKLTAQKSNSKLRSKVSLLKQSISRMKYDNTLKTMRSATRDTNFKFATLTHKLSEKDLMVCELQDTINDLQEMKEIQIKTKSTHGTYSDKLRLCVIQLAGLEVATEKVTPVIQVVSEILFEKKFDKKELPNSTTVQTIIDEGHFIAKAYIAEKIDHCKNWGLNRDGTSRCKQKIIDTAVTLDNGEIASLGFTHVSRETAKIITDVTKNHLIEIADIRSNSFRKHPNEDFIVNSLAKLAFTMSDRASNEKLADKLLNKWRDEMLKSCDNNIDKQSVKNFHCMAHVLLGFHRYICNDIQVLEKSLVDQYGPLGRDSLPIFKFWSKAGTIIERVVRTTSDTFGPAGDHLGLRNRWEAYCTEKGIKSTVGNYRDNRFNGLLQTAAEILVHRLDFQAVIKTVHAPNKKILSVDADLNSAHIVTMLLALGFVYIKVTGPYWELVTSGKVPYLELYVCNQNLRKYLQDCVENPKLIESDKHWLEDVCDIAIEQRFYEVMTSMKIDRNLMNEVITSMCKSMVGTIEKQLADFLPGGQYSEAADPKTMMRTQFAQVTNLGCEHHFGDLDSSQKRRPNASLHHHSSIQLLKRNRLRMKEWYESMTPTEKESLWKNACQGGKDLRIKHKEHQKHVYSEIMDQMNEPPPKKGKLNPNDNDELYESEIDELNTVCQRLPLLDQLKENDYVIFAYQDAWYPGCVHQIKSNDNNNLIIKFMAPCRKAGVFKWPSRDDVQEVKPEFVIATGLIPECLNSGRQWAFPEHMKFDELFAMYSNVFF